MGEYTFTMESVRKVAVLGSGTMGVDIALLFALKGSSVLLWHRKDRSIARSRLDARILKYKEKNILSAEQIDAVLKNVRFMDDLKEIAGCDLIVESIVEDRSEKIKLLNQVAIIAPKTVITTNTSSLSIEDLASELPESTAFAGMHFFNPVLRLELVEIVTCGATSPVTIQLLRDVCAQLDKIPVLVNDSPGFIVNRLMACQICQAIRMLEEGVASAEDIDSALRLGLLHPIGPLALADLIGLDVVLNILSNIFEKTGDESFRPSTKLRHLVESGCLGRKTGSGLYSYN